MNKTEKNDLRGYAFIRNQIIRTGVTPSLRDIAGAVGYKSRHSAEKMLDRLEERDFIKRTKGMIHLCNRMPSLSEQTVNVPLVGSVACGLPSLAEQDSEAMVEVSTKIAHPGHTYFILRARGTSMNRSGINDGDLLLVRQQSTAEEGDKVVALINDDATVKHFHREGGVTVLRPNSTDPTHKPIVLSDEFMIQGIVVATLPENIY